MTNGNLCVSQHPLITNLELSKLIEDNLGRSDQYRDTREQEHVLHPIGLDETELYQSPVRNVGTHRSHFYSP